MKKVTIYSQNACASCMMVKKWLTIKKIAYQEVNLDEHPEQRAEIVEMSGSSTVPIVLIEDTNTAQQTISIGYKPAQLVTAIT
jgi:glutaredoxin 3